MKNCFFLFISLLMGLAMPAGLWAQATEIRVKLLEPISTETSKKGDKITAQALSPPNLQGDILEGHIRQSKSGHKIKGKSVLSFSFDVLHHGNQAIPIQSTVKSVANSKGQVNVDEEGDIIQKKNRIPKAAILMGIGAVAGGIAGGAKGAAMGAGAGAALSLLFIEVAVKAPKVSFSPGSEFVLSVTKR